MRRAQTVDIPPPRPEPFRDGIQHPDLWLWDAWTFRHGESLDLFSLALARVNRDGAPVTPAERNDYPFHVRRFRSADQGRTWRDLGADLQPSEIPGSPTEHNVWSGSARLAGKDLLFGYTGVRRPAAGRSFLQIVCAGLTDPECSLQSSEGIVLSDPERDYDEIRAAGYYLGLRGELGNDHGEEGGPILAWRDPFFLEEEEGVYRAFWAAKVGPSEPAIAQARVLRRGDTLILDDLLPPIVPPDAEDYTQSEVPKVYRNPQDGSLLMLTSTCNRRREDQPDDEVSKELRLFRAKDLDGPWSPYRPEGAQLPGLEHLFGGEFSDVDFENGIATLIAPYTEMAEPDLRLTFAPPRRVDIRDAATLGGSKTLKASSA